MFLADFHIHSTFSDGALSIPELVDLYGTQGFGAIAITDHLTGDECLLGKASAYLNCTLTKATFPLYQAILQSEAQRAWDEYRMVVIPGIELTKNSISNHRSAHILALGTTEMVLPHGDVTEWVDKIHAVGGLAVAAHPVWTRKVEKQTFHLWDRRQELADKIDAWEIASGRHIFEAVQKSGLKVLANSDLHKKRHFESWKTVFSCERHPGAILDAILRQEIGIEYYRMEERSVFHQRHGSLVLPFPLGFEHDHPSLGNLVGT